MKKKETANLNGKIGKLSIPRYSEKGNAIKMQNIFRTNQQVRANSSFRYLLLNKVSSSSPILFEKPIFHSAIQSNMVVLWYSNCSSSINRSKISTRKYFNGIAVQFQSNLAIVLICLLCWFSDDDVYAHITMVSRPARKTTFYKNSDVKTINEFSHVFNLIAMKRYELLISFILVPKSTFGLVSFLHLEKL